MSIFDGSLQFRLGWGDYIFDTPRFKQIIEIGQLKGADTIYTKWRIIMRKTFTSISLIISIAVIVFSSPSFADDNREDEKWERGEKEQSHDRKKVTYRPIAFGKTIHHI